MKRRSYVALAKARTRSALVMASISRPVEVETSFDSAFDNTTQRRASATTIARYPIAHTKSTAAYSACA